MDKYSIVEVYMEVAQSKKNSDVFSYGYVAIANGKQIGIGTKSFKESKENRVNIYAAANIAYTYSNICDKLKIYTHAMYLVYTLMSNKEFSTNMDIISKYREITKDMKNITIEHMYINGVKYFNEAKNIAVNSINNAPFADNYKDVKHEGYSTEYHITRLDALFQSRGIKLNKYTLTLYARIYMDPFWLTNTDVSIDNIVILADIIRSDRKEGILFNNR